MSKGFPTLWKTVKQTRATATDARTEIDRLDEDMTRI